MIVRNLKEFEIYIKNIGFEKIHSNYDYSYEITTNSFYKINISCVSGKYDMVNILRLDGNCFESELCIFSNILYDTFPWIQLCSKLDFLFKSKIRKNKINRLINVII